MRIIILLSLFLAGCAGLETDPGYRPGLLAERSSGSKASLQSYESLHFIIRGRDYSRIIAVSELCERIYRKIMFDTNLLSFKPKENYNIVIYRTRQEYHIETGYPYWSGGGTVTELLGKVLPQERETKARTSIVTFEEAASPSLLAHEISHLVFNEFMDFMTPYDADRVRWLNEGLATYEEMEFYRPGEREEVLRATRPNVRLNAPSLDQAIAFHPFNTEVVELGNYVINGRRLPFTNIDLWYWQVRSIVGFLIEGQGEFKFYFLINALKRGMTVTDAIAEAFPGKWRNLSDLENEWRQSLGRL